MRKLMKVARRDKSQAGHGESIQKMEA